MKPIMSLTMVAAVGIVLGVSMPFFGNRDPIGNADGMNLYEYERSAPTVNRDPSGLWTEPDRDPNMSRATICSDNPNDTWESLSKITKLDADQACHWVHQTNGNAGIPTKPVLGQTYFIPNTIYIDEGDVSVEGDVGGIRSWLLDWGIRRNFDTLRSQLRSAKYLVPFDHKATRHAILEHLADPDAVGWVFGGHGTRMEPDTGLASYLWAFPGRPGDAISAEHAANALDHRLAMVILFGCDVGNDNRWLQLKSHRGFLLMSSKLVYPYLQSIYDLTFYGPDMP